MTYEHEVVCRTCGLLKTVRNVDRVSALAQDYQANHEAANRGHKVDVKTRRKR